MPIFTQDETGQSFLEEYQAPALDVLGADAGNIWSRNSLGVADLSVAEHGYMTLGGDFVPPDSQNVDAAAARARIADAGVDLTVPDSGIPSRALDILIAQKEAERRREDILNRAPSGIGMTALRLTTMLATSAADPLNIAASFVPVVGEERYAAMLARAGSALGRAGVRAGVGAVEGAAGTALVEPLVYAGQHEEQADYGISDSLLNIALGTALGGGLHIGIGALGDALAKARDWRLARANASEEIPRLLEQVPQETREAALRTGVAQAVDGREIDVGAVEPERAALASEAPVASDVSVPGASAAETRAVPVQSFTTEGGETYALNADGTTTRAPTREPAAGEAPVAAEPSAKTVYVDQAQTGRLATPQGEWRVVDHGDGTVSIATPAERGRWGTVREGPQIPVSSTPSRGTVPVELFRAEPGRAGSTMYRGVRVGSPISGIATPIAAARAVSPAARTAADVSSFAPENARLYDAEAARAVHEEIRAAPSDEAMPEQTLEATMEDVSRLAAAVDMTESVAKEMKPYDDLQKTADEYGAAVRAAAECGLRRGVA